MNIDLWTYILKLDERFARTGWRDATHVKVLVVVPLSQGGPGTMLTLRDWG